MPEGPEIHRAADRLHAAIARRKAQRVFFAFPRLESFARELTGRRIRGVEARGKAMLVRFSGDWTVFSHNQLYGRWIVVKAGSLPDTRRSLRFAIHTREQSALLYSASEIAVLHDGEIDRHPYLARLGPDLLAPGVGPAAVARRAVSPRFRRRRWASLLLDQSFLAGVGNYLRSEILFFAGIHPRRRPADCSPAVLQTLARAALDVTRRAYRTGGITNSSDRVTRLRRQGLAFRQYRHAVFGRDGEDCWWCGSRLRRETLAGRRGYFCPTCQPATPG